MFPEVDGHCSNCVGTALCSSLVVLDGSYLSGLQIGRSRRGEVAIFSPVAGIRFGGQSVLNYK